MTRKAIDSIQIVNPSKESLDDLVLKRFDFMRRGYFVEIVGEQISKNINVIKLVVYDK